eukprot:gene27511-2513_t
MLGLLGLGKQNKQAAAKLASRVPDKLNADALANEAEVLLGVSGVPKSADSLAYESSQQLLAVGTSDGRVKLIGQLGVEKTLFSASKRPFGTRQLLFVKNRGLLLRVSEQHPTRAGAGAPSSTHGATQSAAKGRLTLADHTQAGHPQTQPGSMGTRGSPPSSTDTAQRRSKRVTRTQSTHCRHQYAEFRVLLQEPEPSSSATHGTPLHCVCGLQLFSEYPFLVLGCSSGAVHFVSMVAADYSSTSGAGSTCGGSADALEVKALKLLPHYVSAKQLQSAGEAVDVAPRSASLVGRLDPRERFSGVSVDSHGQLMCGCWLQQGDFATGHQSGEILIWKIASLGSSIYPCTPSLQKTMRVVH